MANTVIQLKYSNVTSVPPTLNVAEPAYSNVSNKLFIDDGTGVVAIGGKYYTDIIDAATAAATTNTLVLRDADGSASFNVVTANLFSGSFEGNADTASKWLAPIDLGLAGDATGNVSFDGSANVTLTVDLTASGVAAGTYGGTTNIPVFTVATDGRVTSAANVSVATNLSIAGDTGTDTLSLLSDTLTFVGADGITSVVNAAGNNVAFSVDNTVIRTTGGQTIAGSLSITGDLVISGNTVTQDVTTVTTEDSLIKLAANNVADAIDIGFYGQYTNGGTKYAGLVRDATDGVFKLFTNESIEPTSNVVSYTAADRATIEANFTGGNVSGLFSDIAVADGGTGRGTFTAGSILIGNGTSGLLELANTGTAGSYGEASRTLAITTDAYGRVSAVTNTAIAIDASQVTTGVFPIARGGTNNSSYTTGTITYFDGTKIASLANTGTAGSYGSASDIPVITTDAYGRVSSVSNTAIAIDTSQLITGTLGVARGGSGASSFTVKGVIVSDQSSTTGALSSLTSPTEGHVLQINASGAPTFAHLNGGTF
jgi:hypothetical protein